MVNVGILAAQFDKPMEDLGRTVSRTPTTKTLDNITGREILASGTAANITAIVARVDTTWTQEEIAKLEGADGFIMVKPATTLNEHDLITFDSNTYEVHRLQTFYAAELAMFKYGTLILKS